MKIAILTIGNELMSGRTADTNSSFIAREANLQGWSVEAIMSVEDNFASIKSRLNYLLPLADVVICTGGLGPTVDDITTEAVAQAFGLPLYTDEEVLNHIKAIFTLYKLVWVENNTKQAMFPRGAEVIPNPVGTAAGFALHILGKWIFVIPGVPRETKKMFPEGVIPILRREFPQNEQYIAKQTIKTFGLGEGAVDKKLADIDFAALGVNIGFYPVFPENHIVLVSRQKTQEAAEEKLKLAQDEVTARLDKYIFSYGEETLEEIVAGLLKAKKLTIAVAESCTGGLITSRLTDVAGSSEYLERAAVTYSDAAKISLLSVPAAIIEKHGAVSEETARLMAEGVRKMAGTDLGLASTGIAGPGGGSEAKPVGTVYLALSDGAQTLCRHYDHRWDRKRNKMIFSQAALLTLKNYLQGKG
ncbi:MAG: competence/damage-inducible protein A [Deltaproteobacteria bacterium HGW-Deltaproteobacteria-12]|jgi:nicotinamide-nucleotide amidase|nr:MAG: competence/damage-inducible protein A [Deltaproteobacteria bacterium HGW-Deltaproteobacteria-12]